MKKLRIILEETKTPESLALALNKSWIKSYGTNSMSGNCGKITGMLRDALLKHGHDDFKTVSGTYKGYDGNHSWIELKNGKILDPSVHQYGEHLDVINSPEKDQYLNYLPRVKTAHSLGE
jgi:hypothetical protein